MGILFDLRGFMGTSTEINCQFSFCEEMYI